MKSGTVAVIGRANAGKSTLVNVLVGEKVAIVSPKPQAADHARPHPRRPQHRGRADRLRGHARHL